MSSILEMSSSTITTLYQLSGAEHCSFNFKTQWGKLQWSGSLAGATDRITAFCLCIVGDEWGQSCLEEIQKHTGIALEKTPNASLSFFKPTTLLTAVMGRLSGAHRRQQTCEDLSRAIHRELTICILSTGYSITGQKICHS